jgi:Zn-dependent protease with chaperone function
MVIAPLLFLKQFRKKSVDNNNKALSNFVSKVSNDLSIIRPNVYIVDDAKPFAFSYIKSSIFISLGLIELLSKKELESVILHEIYHVKNSSSLFKFSTFFIRLSPLATFTSFIEDLNKEEKDADSFAAKFQKTSRYLNNAKLKINRYYHFNLQLENII